MTHLVIDSGNTLVKVAAFKDRELLTLERFSDVPSSMEYIQSTDVTDLVVADVNGRFDGHLPFAFRVESSVEMPFKSHYKTMGTLGVDRLANVAGALTLGMQGDLVVADLGSCLTLDLIRDGEHHGGIISPGVQMRLRAMSHFTGKLPELDVEALESEIGESTKECMQLGALGGVEAELNFWMNRWRRQEHKLFLIMTGGGSFGFELDTGCDIFADPELTLKGINEIFIHNQSL